MRTEPRVVAGVNGLSVLPVGLFGWVVFLPGLAAERNEAAFARHARAEPAVVLETNGLAGIGPGGSVHVRLANEREEWFEAWDPDDYTVGRAVTVLVDRDNPDRMRLAGEEADFVSLPLELLFAVACVTTVVAVPVGLWLLVRERTRQGARRETEQRLGRHLGNGPHPVP